MWTKKQAENRAKNLKAINGKPWIVFRLPEDATLTAWAAIGGKVTPQRRYGNCLEDEREYYREHGATFPDEN